MKRKKVNGFLAVLLAAAMALGQPASVYATEAIPMETNESVDETTEPAAAEAEAEETAEGENATDEVGTEEAATDESEAAGSTEETAEETTVEETSTEETAEETTAEETVTEETTEETTEEETSTEETATETETEDEDIILGDEISQKTLKQLGFQTMSLSPSMVAEKEELYQVTAAMSSMKPEEDYVEHEVVYFAQDEEEAKQVAECYGGTLIDYEYGVAVASIEATVKDAVTVAANARVSLPAVYPNILYHINDGWETGTDVEAEPEETGQLIDEADVEHEELLEAEGDGLELPHEDEHLYATAPNDTYFNKQWHHENINTVEAWNATKGKNVIVAVIDSGIDYDHPDLKDNIIGHISTIAGDTGDGRDDNGHGTHCAGIIAATANNGIGVSGVAPEAKLYSVKALNAKGAGKTSDIIKGIESVINRGDVDVISMSLGGIFWDNLYQKTIDKAVNNGIVVIAAAGNEATDQKSYPAAYNNAISVAASDEQNYLTGFSNHGNWVDIAAPGYNILSTLPTDFQLSADTGVRYEAAGYGYMSGTSMACPTVAGTVALMLGNSDELRTVNKKTSVTKITKALLNSAVPDGTYNQWEFDYYPFLDAEASTYAVDNSEVVAPTITFSSTPSNKNVVLAGKDQYFELTTTTPHSKIYYTINGKKPTAKTGELYTGKIYMPASGKVKIQAITVVGSKTSKVFSKTYTFDVKAEKLSSSCKDKMTVAIGKSIQLSVDFAPAYTSNKTLKWESQDATGMIKVDKKGKVTCNKNAQEGLSTKITATTTDGTELKYEFTVEAVSDKVDAITLNATALNMSYWADYSGVTMKDASGKAYTSTFRLVPSSSGVQTDQYLYKSSNPKVAYVDAYGNITALEKGKATITVTANDGSGKKATCKVTVVTPVVDIYMYSSTGYSGNSEGALPIGTGCSVTMKTIINDNMYNNILKPNNKGLEWVSDKPDLVTVKNGKVTCKKDTPIGTVVTITAKAKDGFGCSSSVRFVVTDKIKKLVYVDANKRNTNKSAVSCRMAVGEGILDLLVNEASPDFVGIVTEHNTDQYFEYFTVSTTNRDVVYRVMDEDYGVVIWGTKPGSSKVVYTARDGSNAKFTINFKITN
ncbi:MAG: S8 family serine peptidase [Lachnospiraceae bacterium]|nr:S8 family serine peptidase [Lachnospiraceae bacterium]